MATEEKARPAGVMVNSGQVNADSPGVSGDSWAASRNSESVSRNKPAVSRNKPDAARSSESVAGDSASASGGAARVNGDSSSTIADHATFEKPMQFATGVRDVFVNGVQVLKGGEPTGATPGRFVKGPGWTGWPGGGECAKR